MATLRLQFHDVDDRHRAALRDDPDVIWFDRAMAEKIAKFLNHVVLSPPVEMIVCQCENGVSRSPAVAAALSEYFPPCIVSKTMNRRVYRLVRQAMERWR